MINGYEWTQAHGRDYLATRPVLRLSIAIDDAARRPDPELG